MTFSICVHEKYEGDDGTEQHRFGVAVTTRLAGVGTLCPFASENGAVATQSLVNVELGEKGIEYIDDGLAVEDALQSLLNADDGAENRQLHGVDREGSFVFSGEECKPWFGHHDGNEYTVAGNLLTGEAVIDAVADTYENSDRGEPLAKRLIDALEAGHEEGGDKREDLPVQSAALLVETTEERAIEPAYENLRVDATETPIEDLKATYETAVRGHEDAMERYEEAYEDDDL
ncbi:DUF1028 domain-containing protein [Natronomonas gomsonensis]|uniref:DUF1028 domain-containing protein n=1 Tax=Natronomonas gomsonensis TaxID=1046043 RepID=UPI0020CA49CF|nr:DUF1028 domain-containing protein [Natronomonas gomsonensis]MCY4729503.1 DUF1028 domain-containing protein [Natronomonas gomsonensis]